MGWSKRETTAKSQVITAQDCHLRPHKGTELVTAVMNAIDGCFSDVLVCRGCCNCKVSSKCSLEKRSQKKNWWKNSLAQEYRYHSHFHAFQDDCSLYFVPLHPHMMLCLQSLEATVPMAATGKFATTVFTGLQTYSPEKPSKEQTTMVFKDEAKAKASLEALRKNAQPNHW